MYKSGHNVLTKKKLEATPDTSTWMYYVSSFQIWQKTFDHIGEKLVPVLDSNLQLKRKIPGLSGCSLETPGWSFHGGL